MYIDIKKHPDCKHLGLVFKVAKKLIKIKTSGLEFDDLINIGYLTLNSCYKLKIDSPVYIYRALENNMRHAINQRYFVKISRSGQHLATLLDKGLPVPLSQLSSAQHALKSRHMSQKYFDIPIYKNLIDDLIETQSLYESIHKLSEKEQTVINLHFGLGGIEAMTIREISKEMGIDRGTVHNINKSAIGKLRGLICA